MEEYIMLFVGASGSGKTTVADTLCNLCDLKQVYSYTTRPPRGENEIGHTFVTEAEFDQLHDFVGYTVYNGYRYGATTEQVEECDIYVIDPNGVRYFLDIYKGKKKVCIVYFDISYGERFERMLARGDSYSKAKERIEVDEKEFENVTELLLKANKYIVIDDSYTIVDACIKIKTEMKF